MVMVHNIFGSSYLGSLWHVGSVVVAEISSMVARTTVGADGNHLGSWGGVHHQRSAGLVMEYRSTSWEGGGPSALGEGGGPPAHEGGTTGIWWGGRGGNCKIS